MEPILACHFCASACTAAVGICGALLQFFQSPLVKRYIGDEPVMVCQNCLHLAVEADHHAKKYDAILQRLISLEEFMRSNNSSEAKAFDVNDVD